MLDFNATQAAIRAGFSPKCASSKASILLTNPKVQKAIALLKTEVQQETLVTVEYVISRFKEVAERCLGPGLEFDATGACRALEALGRHVGAFAEDNKQQANHWPSFEGNVVVAIANKTAKQQRFFEKYQNNPCRFFTEVLDVKPEHVWH